MTFFFQMCRVVVLGVQLGRNVDRTSHPPAVHTIASSGRASVEGNSELEKLSCKAWCLYWDFAIVTMNATRVLLCDGNGNCRVYICLPCKGLRFALQSTDLAR